MQAALQACLVHDDPSLFDLLEQLRSHENGQYYLPSYFGSPLKSRELREVKSEPIPQAIRNAIRKSDFSKASVDFLALIKCFYFIVGGKLFLLQPSYLSVRGSSSTVLEYSLNAEITSVGVCRVKPGIFVSEVKFALCIATVTHIALFPLFSDAECTDGDTRFTRIEQSEYSCELNPNKKYGRDFVKLSQMEDDTHVCCVVSKNCRIWFGMSNGQVFELDYFAQTSMFGTELTAKCTKHCLNDSMFSRLVSMFLVPPLLGTLSDSADDPPSRYPTRDRDASILMSDASLTAIPDTAQDENGVNTILQSVRDVNPLRADERRVRSLLCMKAKMGGSKHYLIALHSEIEISVFEFESEWNKDDDECVNSHSASKPPKLVCHYKSLMDDCRYHNEDLYNDIKLRITGLYEISERFESRSVDFMAVTNKMDRMYLSIFSDSSSKTHVILEFVRLRPPRLFASEASLKKFGPRALAQSIPMEPSFQLSSPVNSASVTVDPSAGLFALVERNYGGSDCLVLLERDSLHSKFDSLTQSKRESDGKRMLQEWVFCLSLDEYATKVRMHQQDSSAEGPFFESRRQKSRVSALSIGLVCREDESDSNPRRRRFLICCTKQMIYHFELSSPMTAISEALLLPNLRVKRASISKAVLDYSRVEMFTMLLSLITAPMNESHQSLPKSRVLGGFSLSRSRHSRKPNNDYYRGIDAVIAGRARELAQKAVDEFMDEIDDFHPYMLESLEGDMIYPPDWKDEVMVWIRNEDDFVECADKFGSSKVFAMWLFVVRLVKPLWNHSFFARKKQHGPVMEGELDGSSLTPRMKAGDLRRLVVTVKNLAEFLGNNLDSMKQRIRSYSNSRRRDLFGARFGMRDPRGSGAMDARRGGGSVFDQYFGSQSGGSKTARSTHKWVVRDETQIETGLTSLSALSAFLTAVTECLNAWLFLSIPSNFDRVVNDYCDSESLGNLSRILTFGGVCEGLLSQLLKPLRIEMKDSEGDILAAMDDLSMMLKWLVSVEGGSASSKRAIADQMQRLHKICPHLFSGVDLFSLAATKIIQGGVSADSTSGLNRALQMFNNALKECPLSFELPEACEVLRKARFFNGATQLCLNAHTLGMQSQQRDENWKRLMDDVHREVVECLTALLTDEDEDSASMSDSERSVQTRKCLSLIFQFSDTRFQCSVLDWFLDREDDLMEMVVFPLRPRCLEEYLLKTESDKPTKMKLLLKYYEFIKDYSKLTDHLRRMIFGDGFGLTLSLTDRTRLLSRASMICREHGLSDEQFHQFNKVLRRCKIQASVLSSIQSERDSAASDESARYLDGLAAIEDEFEWTLVRSERIFDVAQQHYLWQAAFSCLAMANDPSVQSTAHRLWLRVVTSVTEDEQQDWIGEFAEIVCSVAQKYSSRNSSNQQPWLCSFSDSILPILSQTLPLRIDQQSDLQERADCYLDLAARVMNADLLGCYESNEISSALYSALRRINRDKRDWVEQNLPLLSLAVAALPCLTADRSAHSLRSLLCHFEESSPAGSFPESHSRLLHSEHF